jgi:hypothetical protein
MASKTITQESDEIKDKEIDNETVVLKGLTGYTIKGVTFSFNKSEEDMLVLDDCVDCKIIDCTFKDKDTKGNFIHIRGEKSKRNRIERCTFKNQTFDGENGGEAIIIGLDRWTGCKFKTYVQNCEFNNCRGDPELVSIKSCENELKNNRIISNGEKARGNFTVRNGGFNIIQNNVFEGSGGIRVLGDGNKITGNYHKNNDNEKFRPLAIENGDIEDDENIREGEPIDKEDKKTTRYARAKNNLIEDNIYENCEGICVVWGKATSREFKPKKNTFKNNLLIAEDKDSRFLRVVDENAELEDNENTLEDNKMYGEKAESGDIPDDAIVELSEKPQFKIPDAGP